MPKGAIYLYYKKGRVGDRLHNSERLDEMNSARDAVKEFVKLFEQLTGNEFEPWEREKTFEKKRNKFYPIDMVCVAYWLLFTSSICGVQDFKK